MDDDSSELTDSLETVLSGGALVFVGKGIGLGMGFLTQLIMARLLTTSDYGSVILAIAVVNIVSTFAKVGLDESMVRKIPEHEDSPEELRGVSRAGLLISGSAGVCATVLIVVFAPVISDRVFGNPGLTALLRVGSLAIPLTVMGQVSTSVARGARDAKPHTVVNEVVRPTGRLVLIGIFIGAGFEAVGAVAGQTLAYGIAAIVALWFAYRTIPEPGATTRRMYRTTLAFSLPLVLVHGMNVIISNTDTFLLGYYLDTSKVGIYNIAYQIRNLLNILLVAFGFLVPSMIAKLETEGEYDQLRSVYQFTTKWIVFLTFPMFASLLFIPNIWLGTVFGTEYLPGTTALQLLGLGVMASAMMGVSGSTLVGLGKNRVVMYTSVVTMVVNIILNILLIPRIGIEGAALASTSAVVVTEIINLYFLYDRFSVLPMSPEYLLLILCIGAVPVLIRFVDLLKISKITYFVVWVVAYCAFIGTLGISNEDKETVSKIVSQEG
ncbi:flippase [Halosimplex amylolyticum]|uniref:flippase n=1 Tax=Halosimplex amylolyticum TaxID=3396616 RepID=UPI003F564F8C